MSDLATDPVIIRLTESSYGDVLSMLAQAPIDGSCQVSIGPVKISRSDAQNRLSFKWYGEMAAYTGHGVAYERARCKLIYGVQILRVDNEKFRLVYDKYLRQFTYEEKLEIMETMEIPVTSIMGVKQMALYLNTMDMETSSKMGLALTHPSDLYHQSMGVK